MPREGHFRAVLRIFGYLCAYSKGKIIIDTRYTENHNYEENKQNWKELYPGTTEEIPNNMPTPLGKSVEISTYVDASFANDLKNRRSVTGFIIFINKTPIKWYTKRQNTI